MNRERPSTNRFLLAICYTAEFYAANGNQIADVVARRTNACRGDLDQWKSLVAPLTEEYKDSIPEPLLMLMADAPVDREG